MNTTVDCRAPGATRRRSRRWIVATVLLAALTTTRAALAVTQVVATIFPLADLVRRIGTDYVDVQTLLPAGASPHTFEPTPAQLRAIVNSNVLVRVGAGLDDWVDGLLKAGNPHTAVVTITDGLDLLRSSGATRGDPHVWLDPVLVRDRVLPALVQALSRADAARHTDFERAATAFAAELTQLDQDIASALAPLTRRGYVATHPAWRYFGARYHLEEVAVVEDSPGKEPSAQSVAQIIEKARAQHVAAVLTELQLSRRMAEVIAAECGATVVDVDPLGGAQLAGRNTYVAMMRYNLAAFVQALK